MEDNIILIVAILGLLMLIAIVVLIVFNKHRKFVVLHSVAISKLKDLNSQYDFYTNIRNFDEKHTYDNQNFYNDISCEDYLIYNLQFKKWDIQKEIKLVANNRANYNKYCQDVKLASVFGEYNITTKNLSKKWLLMIEKRLFANSKLNPVVNFSVNVVLYCSKINGDIYRSKRQTFSEEQIQNLIKKLNDKNGNFYMDRYVWDAICRVERGRVSNKMRFSIYARDGYRCRICGRSDKYAYLEIDHIKPIAKGGKSTYDNLQTLCHRCNKEKSDKY